MIGDMTDNYFSCGPFTRCTETELLKEMECLGLGVTDDGNRPPIMRAVTGGWRIEARGSAVRGYFLAGDGEEAEVQDVKRLVFACCHPGQELRISGSAEIASGRLLITSARVSHDGAVVRWTATRTVLAQGAKGKTFRDDL